MPRRSKDDDRDSRWRIPVEAMRPEDVTNLIEQAHLDAAIHRAILDNRKKQGITKRLYSNAVVLDSWLGKFWRENKKDRAAHPVPFRQ